MTGLWRTSLSWDMQPIKIPTYAAPIFSNVCSCEVLAWCLYSVIVVSCDRTRTHTQAETRTVWQRGFSMVCALFRLRGSGFAYDDRVCDTIHHTPHTHTQIHMCARARVEAHNIYWGPEKENRKPHMYLELYRKECVKCTYPCC